MLPAGPERPLYPTNALREGRSVTALADALVQAQSRAVAALGKQYVGGTMDEDTVRMALASTGPEDQTDTNRWLAALAVIRETGAAMPRENGAAEKPPEPMTPAQRSLIELLVTEKNVPAPDLEQRTKQEAHEIIDTLKAGTYDPVKWSIPF